MDRARSPTFLERSNVVGPVTSLASIVGHRCLHHHNVSVDVLDQEFVVANEGRDILDVRSLVTLSALRTPTVEGGPVVDVGV